MALLAIATGISVYNSPLPGWGVIQAIVLLGALGCAIYLFSARPEKDWYAGRAVAESIKTISWRFMIRAEPYTNSDDEDRHNFGLRLKSIVVENKDISGKLTTHLAGEIISAEMERIRSLSSSERQTVYRDDRIVDQLKWYANKAAFNKRKVTIYFSALMFVLFLGIVFALLKIMFPTAPFWPTDIFVTVAAGLLSWIQAKRYQELSVSYALTAHEISLIRQRASSAMSDKELSEFVGDAENAFSREHTQWIARQDK